MKKLFTIFLLSHLLIFSNNEDNKNQNKPNLITLQNPLPIEALEDIFKDFSHEFPTKLSTTNSQSFYTFLKEREKAIDYNQAVIQNNEESLLINLTNNYNANNKILPPHILSMCAFANSLSQLRHHQVIAELQAYPKENHILTSFEQNYTFKLFPIPYHTFIALTALIPSTKASHILKITKKRWAHFLLHRLAKQ